MGILDSIGIKRESAGGGSTVTSTPGTTVTRSSGSSPAKAKAKGRRKGKGVSAAAPLHERRKRLVTARETTLRDLGGLMLEMYKRNRFREELLLDKCEEVLAIEVEVAHIDQRLFQLAPPTAAGQRPIGRCECGAPIHPGQNFCGVCGRGFGTLTQARVCERCGTGLRAGDSFCASCGHQAPDVLEALEAPATPPPSRARVESAQRGPGTPAAHSDAATTTIVTPPPVVDASPIVDAQPVIEPVVSSPPPAAAPATPAPAAPATPAPAATAPPSSPAPAAAAPAATAPARAPNSASGATSTGGADTDLHDTAMAAALSSLPGAPAAGNGRGDSASFGDVFDATPAAKPTPSSSPAPKGGAPAAKPDRAARKQAREQQKRIEQLRRAKAKAAKERAKERAKAAKAERKRGDGSK